MRRSPTDAPDRAPRPRTPDPFQARARTAAPYSGGTSARRRDDRRPQRLVLRREEHRPGECAVAPGRVAPHPFVALGPVGGDALDRGGRRGHAEGDALPRQRVHVAGRVADEEHPAGRAPGDVLLQRSRAEDTRGRFRPRQPRRERGERREPPGVARPPDVGEDRDAHLARADRGDVRLRARRPVHLDQVGPRLDDVVAAQPVARPHARRRGAAAPSAGPSSAARRRRAARSRPPPRARRAAPRRLRGRTAAVRPRRAGA